RVSRRFDRGGSCRAFGRRHDRQRVDDRHERRRWPAFRPGRARPRHARRRRHQRRRAVADDPPRDAARLSLRHRARNVRRPGRRADGVLRTALTMAHVPAERCLGIIELLADGAREMPLGEIAERLAVPKSGAHRMLATLVDLGWAEQDHDTGFYRLTMRLAVLGQRFYAASGVPDICQPLIDRLARECSEFVRLAVVDGNALVWIAHAQGARAGLVYRPAETTGTVPLYATASGKAWLATLRSED